MLDSNKRTNFNPKTSCLYIVQYVQFYNIYLRYRTFCARYDMNRTIRIDIDNYARNKQNITKKKKMEKIFYSLDLLSKLQVIKEILQIEKNSLLKKE